MDYDIETILLNYIHGSVNPEQKKQVEDLISQDENWREKHNEMLQLHQLMQTSLTLEFPSVRFTKNVMDEIALAEIAPSAQTYINGKIINLLCLFFVISILGLIVYTFFKTNWKISQTDQSMIEQTLKNYLRPQILNIFLAINAFLCLILLDKLLIRNYKRI